MSSSNLTNTHHNTADTNDDETGHGDSADCAANDDYDTDIMILLMVSVMVIIIIFMIVMITMMIIIDNDDD